MCSYADHSGDVVGLAEGSGAEREVGGTVLPQAFGVGGVFGVGRGGAGGGGGAAIGRLELYRPRCCQDLLTGMPSPNTSSGRRKICYRSRPDLFTRLCTAWRQKVGSRLPGSFP